MSLEMASGRRRGVLLSTKENVPPRSPSTKEGKDTPRALQQGMIGGKIAAMRERWDEQVQNTSIHTDSTARESPTLIHLQKTNERSVQKEQQTKGSVYSKQRTLQRLHHEAKSRVEGVGGVAGGISIWPAMDDMRLSKSDAMQLSFLCLVLMAATGTLFMTYHRVHIAKLHHYTEVLGEFTSTHPLSVDRGQDVFDDQVLHWHNNLMTVEAAIQSDFDVIWSEASTFDICSTVLYIGGVAVLLYFLAENVFSKNRLTPRRIKIWVSLLCVVGVWSVFSVHLLVCAQALETAMEATALSLIDRLGELIPSELDLSKYRDVLLYWQSRYLQTTSRGLLSVLGWIPVKDVSFYMHYYSLPILTALCTPLIKLIISLKTVYASL